MRRTILALTALATALSSAPLGAEPLRLAPTSNWNIDYGEDKCSLIRTFGTGDNEILLHIDQSGTGPFYNLALSGKQAGRTAGDVMRIAFGPNEDASERSFLVGKPKAPAEPFILMHGIHLAPATRTAEKRGFEVAQIGPEREKAITTLTLAKGLRETVELQIGPMDAPLAALRTCVADLVESLKLDPAGISDIARAPQTKNIRKLVEYIQQRFPARQAANGDDGTVSVRLTVSDKGRVTQCQIAESDRPAVFDDAACFGFLRMAEFEPAIGTDGKPRYGFWQTRVTYRTN